MKANQSTLSRLGFCAPPKILRRSQSTPSQCLFIFEFRFAADFLRCDDFLLYFLELGFLLYFFELGFFLYFFKVGFFLYFLGLETFFFFLCLRGKNEEKEDEE